MDRRESGEARRDVLVTALALASVGVALYQLSEPAVGARFTWLDVVDLVIVAFFAYDLVVEARASGMPGRYVARHWWELPSLIPSIAGLLLGSRWIPLVRLVRVVRLMRIFALLPRFRPAALYVVRLARRARLGTILSVAAGILALGALVAYALERGANPRMATLGDSAWWALNMFTNVAYVDFQPATAGGRVLAGLLQLLGIGFIGVFTASLAGAIVREPEPDEDPE